MKIFKFSKKGQTLFQGYFPKCYNQFEDCEIVMGIRELFNVFSDPVRLKMVELLKERDWTPSQLAEELGLSRPTITHHLNLMRNAGVVNCTKQGKEVICSLEETVFQEILEFAARFLRKKGGENED